MRKYKSTPAGNVIEHPTQQIVAQCKTATEAKVVAQFLNNGGSFNGWTPSFFLANAANK